MIANPLVENLLSDLGLLGRLSSDSSFLYPAWFQRQRKITDIVVDLGNKSIQSQRLVFSVFEPEGGGGGLDSSGGVTKNVIRDQLLEVPNLTCTYPKIRRLNRLQFSVQHCQTISFLPMKHRNFLFPIISNHF